MKVKVEKGKPHHSPGMKNTSSLRELLKYPGGPAFPYMAAATCLFRCRKCRERVFDSRCVVTVHGEQHSISDGSAVLPSGVSCQDVAMEDVWYITDDSAPAWIVNNIETELPYQALTILVLCHLVISPFVCLLVCVLTMYYVLFCDGTELPTASFFIVPPRAQKRTLPLGAERLFREVDLVTVDPPGLDSEKRRSLDDVNYSPTCRTRSSVSKQIGIKILQKKKSDVHLQYVLDQSYGNRKSEQMEVKENFFNGDNLQQTGNHQQESHGVTKSAESSKSGQGHNMLPEGQGHNMLPECQGHNMLPEGQGNQDFSEDQSPSGIEHAEGPCHSDVTGDDQGHPDTSGVVKQRNRRKRRKRNAVASLSSPPADNDEKNDVVNPVYPEKHICPICLDLYCHPMRTHPCDHVFCDPCLRRLARATPVNTPCPLCRRVISKCHGADELALELKTWYAVLYKKRQVNENKFRNNSYHKLPESNSSDLRPNMARIRHYPRQPVWERFRGQMAAAPLPMASCVMAVICLIAVFGFICLKYVIGYAFRTVGALLQVIGQAVEEFVGSVFVSPHVESFQSESPQSLLRTSVRVRAMTANFCLIVIFVIICRYVFFRRVFFQLGRNV